MNSICSLTDSEMAILIPYIPEENRNATLFLIAVRPETNKVIYESEIIKSVQPYIKAAYMANISGLYIKENKIIESRYSLQIKFARNGKEEIAKYPPFIQNFEKKFQTKFTSAPIIGSYDIITYNLLGKNEEELFNTIVPREDMLDLYGQTIKKIGAYYVVNYDMPAIGKKYHNGTDIFVILVRLTDLNRHISDINHEIYERFMNNDSIDILDSEKRKSICWYNQVKRTYHISWSHIQAMFDMVDYIFNNDHTPIKFIDTPLGALIAEKQILPLFDLEKKLKMLKNNPLVYLTEKNGDPGRLTNLVFEGRLMKKDMEFTEKSLLDCCDIINRIDWKKSFPA